MTHRKKNYDRKALHDKLEVCINPIDPEQYTVFVNVATGVIVTHPAVNVDNAIQKGKTQMSCLKEDGLLDFTSKFQGIYRHVADKKNTSR